MENSRSDSAGSNLGGRCMVASAAAAHPGRSAAAAHRRLAPVPAPLAFEQLVAEVTAQPCQDADIAGWLMLSGEVVLVLDDTETVLRAGDVVVQRGTSHRWENRPGATARMAFILIDGAFTAELLGMLGPDVLAGLLHDPMHAPGAGA